MSTTSTETALPPKEGFESNIDGRPTHLHWLQTDRLQAAVTNYGARLVSLLVPGADGRLTDVVTGFDTLQAYFDARPYFYGSTVGRYANRIAFGKFVLDGKAYQLSPNLGRHHLHGGFKNFQEVVWEEREHDNTSVAFSYISADGEEGYPGNLTVNVRYQLNSDALHIFFAATTDEPTVLNLTNHAYFNLNGQGSGPMLDHELQINADHFTPTDADSIPSGFLTPVAGTPFDFRQPKRIGADMYADDEQLRNGSGYDHNFALNKAAQNELSFAARAKGDQSGIVMEVHTKEPGMQLYGGNFLIGNNRMRSGDMDLKHSAFCLETQHFPDSPNQPQFPSTVLRPREQFRSETIFKFRN